MTQPDARQMALASLTAYQRAETGLDFAEVTAAALVAIAAALTEPATAAPGPAPRDDTESRQPTGLNRLLAEPTPAHLPGNVVVWPAEWYVWSEDRTAYYGIVTYDTDKHTYATYRGDGVTVWDHQSLASAVAYLIQRRTEETGDAS